MYIIASMQWLISSYIDYIHSTQHLLHISFFRQSKSTDPPTDVAEDAGLEPTDAPTDVAETVGTEPTDSPTDVTEENAAEPTAGPTDVPEEEAIVSDPPVAAPTVVEDDAGGPSWSSECNRKVQLLVDLFDLCRPTFHCIICLKIVLLNLNGIQIFFPLHVHTFCVLRLPTRRE